MCKRSNTARLLSSVDGPTLPSVATGTAALPLGTAEGLQPRAQVCQMVGTAARLAPPASLQCADVAVSR